jgi:hypothetical protein
MLQTAKQCGDSHEFPNNYLKRKEVRIMKRVFKIVFCFLAITILSVGFLASPALASDAKPIVNIYEIEPNNTINQANVLSNNYYGEHRYYIYGTITNYYYDVASHSQ